MNSNVHAQSNNSHSACKLWLLLTCLFAQNSEDEAVIVKSTPAYKKNSLLCCLSFQLHLHKIITEMTPDIKTGH